MKLQELFLSDVKFEFGEISVHQKILLDTDFGLVKSWQILEQKRVLETVSSVVKS